jgi:hypothetical protein
MWRYFMRRAFVLVVLLAFGILGGSLAATAQEFVLPENLPALAAPIIVTTCGQSPGALMFKLICDEVAIPCEENDLITAEDLAAAFAEGVEAQPPSVLVVTTGTSLKGMGAAGIDVDAEVARCVALIEKAKELGLVVIVAQIEGPSRRVDEYDQASIEGTSPLADLLITRSDIDGDGYFTTLAEENGIPQIFIDDTLDLEVLLPLLFPQA